MNLEKIIELLAHNLKPTIILDKEPHTIPPAICVPPQRIAEACQVLHRAPRNILRLSDLYNSPGPWTFKTTL